MRIAGRSALLIALACASLAACSGDGDDEPVTLPTTTASSPSVEPSTSPPTATSAEPTPTTTLVLPDEHDASVDLLIETFFDRLNEAQATGDFASLDALYLPQCTTCADLRAEIANWLKDGQSVVGGEWSIIDSTSDALADGSQGGFTALAFRAPLSITAEDGSEVGAQPRTGVLLLNAVVVAGDPWLISNLGYREA